MLPQGAWELRLSKQVKENVVPQLQIVLGRKGSVCLPARDGRPGNAQAPPELLLPP